MKTGSLKRMDTRQVLQIVAVIGLFMICRIFSMSVFYDGFLKTFEALNRRVFGEHEAPVLFTQVPYHSGSLFLSALKHPVFSGGLALLYAPFLLMKRTAGEPLFVYTRAERCIAFTCAFLLTWELSTGAYNYYLGQAFWFDRLALVVLTLLLLRYPLLTPLFLVLALLFRSQFNYHVEGFALPDKRVLFDLLILFMVFMYLRGFSRDLKVPFLFFAACVVASNYFISGAQKILLSPYGYEWVLDNDPRDLFMNVHYRGWMAKAGEHTIGSIYRFLSVYGKWLQALVFLTELGALLVMRSKKTAVFIFAALGVMHLGIFIFGSMLFWKFIVLDLLLAYLFFTGKNENVFSKQLFAASLVLILSSGIWLKPLHIAWWDTPFTQYFTYEVTDVNGVTYALEKNEMEPYHQWFQYDKFGFLVDRPLLMVSGFGYTNTYQMSQDIKRTAPDEIARLEKTKGTNRFNIKQKENYEDFIRTYFSRRNKRLGALWLPDLIKAPQHLYNGAAGVAYHDQAPVRKFRVIFNQVYTVNGKSQPLTGETVDEIEIPF